jgi:hypothetical protein
VAIMPDIKLNNNERAEFYKVLPNDLTIKLATIHSNEYLDYFIENNLCITDDITPDKVDAVIGLVFNNSTNALTKICYWNPIEASEEIEDDDELQSRRTIEESKTEIDI